MAKVLQFEVAGLLDLQVSVKKDEGRLDRYLRRIDDGTGRDGKVQYSASVVGDWTLWHKGVDSDDKGKNSVDALPVFFETRYFVRCDFHGSVSDARVVHRMASVSDAFDFEKGTLVGVLDFVNSPGKFRFVIEYKRGGVWHSLNLEWMVVSEKMDVETDLKRITDVIKKASPSLVHAFLAKTLTSARVGPDGNRQDDNLWFSLFEKVFDELRTAVELIVNRPHLKYTPVAEYLRAEKIKRWTPTLANRFQCMDEGRRGVALFRSERIDPETDTVENRFVLFVLRELARHLGDFAAACAEHETISSDFVKTMREKRDVLLRLAANPFFKGVGRFTGFRQESLALQRKPGYSRIYIDWLVLQQSLDPHGASIDIGYRPISSLYEFWCFLVIRDKIAATNEFKCPTPIPTIGSLDGLNDIFDDPDKPREDVALNKVAYEFDSVNGSNRKLTLVYQQSYNTGAADGAFVYLNPQRPDIVLTIKDKSKPDGEGEYSYIFDAKYRIRPAGDDVPDATTTEAIDAMHQYRDAILYRKQKDDKHLSREIIGAYVLYPGRPHPKSRDYNPVIKAENIGAIPLLPAERDASGKYLAGQHGEDALDAFLSEILGKVSQEQHLGLNSNGYSSVIPTRGTTMVVAPSEAEYLATDVVYGTYRNSGGFNQLDWIKEKRLYNMPIDKAEEIGIVDEASAKAKSMLFLVSSRKEKPSVFRVKRGSATKIKQSDLVSIHGYSPRKPEPEKEYWLWELEIE